MKLTTKITSFAATLLFVVTPVMASAQLFDGGITPAECVGDLGILCSGSNDDFGKIAGLLFIVIKGFLQLLTVVAFGVLVYCGAMYVMSRGDQELARRAKMCMIYAVIGIIVAGFSGIIVNSTINLWR